MGRAHKLLSQEEQQLLSLSLPLSQVTDHTSFLLTGATADSSGLGFSRKFVCFSPPALPLSRHGFLFFCCPPLPPRPLPALTRTTTCGARPTNRARVRGGFPTHAQPRFSLTCILRPAWHRPCNKTAPDTREQKEEAARRSPQLRSCCLQNAQTRSSATPPSASICGLIFAVALILGLDAFLAAHVADRIEVFVLAALPQVVTLKNSLDILKSTLSPRAASGPSYWYSGLLQVVLVVEVFVCEKKEHPHTPHGHTICASEQRQ